MILCSLVLTAMAWVCTALQIGKAAIYLPLDIEPLRRKRKRNRNAVSFSERCVYTPVMVEQ